MASAVDMRWNCMNTKEDLIKMFTGYIDHDVIEMIIECRNNDLLLAYRDLLQLTNPAPNSSVELYTEEKQVMNSENDAFNTLDNVNWDKLSSNETPTSRILYLVSKGYKVMIIMRGCPGSGKSYQATNILNQCYKNVNCDEFIYSADKFFINRKTGRYHFDRYKIKEAHQWAFSNTQKAVKNEITPIIIDNTNVELWEMENYVKLSVNNGYWIEILEPNTEWAWDGYELSKKNSHQVPYHTILRMLQQYERMPNVESLLKKFKFKYNKNNQPPKLSNTYKKYQLCELLKDEEKKVNKPPNEINDQYISDQFKDLHISTEYINCKQNYEWPVNNINEDSWTECTINEKEIKDSSQIFNSIENKEDFINNIPSNFIDKSVNTYENDFLFMQVLEEIPSEEYNQYVFYGKYRDINEGNNSNILKVCDGKLDKGTMTLDDTNLVNKPTFDDLQKQFPQNVCSLIIELFDKCEGNIDWIVDVLIESGHDITKQQLHGLVKVENSHIGKSFNDNNTQEATKSDLIPDIICSTPQMNIKDKIESEIKINKNTNDFKSKLLELDKYNNYDVLKKELENKFVFGESSYSEHLLNIKKIKEGYDSTNNCTKMLPTIIDVGTSVILNDIEENSNQDDTFVQLVVDTSVLIQLCDYFGDSSSELNKNTMPMSVKLPEKLAEDLYFYLVANVPPNIVDQEAILQDETLAKKLHEETMKENFPGTSNSINNGELTFSAVLSRKLLLEKFKNLDSKLVLNVLRAKDYKFQEASDVLSKVSGITPITNKNKENILSNDDDDYYFQEEQLEDTSTQNYTQEALQHANVRQQFLSKANLSISSKIHPAVTAYYLDKAEESKQNEKYAKTKALVAILTNNKNVTTLDLHYLQVQEALIVLDLYLDNHITYLKKLSGLYNRGRQLTIITGRGKHSPKGIARIRPVVLRRLQIRGLTYMEPEKPGMIMVIIKKTSLLSSQI